MFPLILGLLSTQAALALAQESCEARAEKQAFAAAKRSAEPRMQKLKSEVDQMQAEYQKKVGKYAKMGVGKNLQKFEEEKIRSEVSEKYHHERELFASEKRNFKSQALSRCAFQPDFQ